MTSCPARGAMISVNATACPRCGAIFNRTIVAPYQVPLDVVSDGWAGLKPRRFGARSVGAGARWRSSSENFLTRRAALRFCLRDVGGRFVCPACGGGRAVALKSRPRLLECLDCDADLAHRRHGDASSKLPLTTCSGGASNGDAFQRHVGATIGGPTRRHLQDGLAAGAEASALDGRSQPRSSEGVVEVDQTEIPFRAGDAFFEPSSAARSWSPAPSR